MTRAAAGAGACRSGLSVAAAAAAGVGAAGPTAGFDVRLAALGRASPAPPPPPSPLHHALDACLVPGPRRLPRHLEGIGRGGGPGLSSLGKLSCNRLRLCGCGCGAGRCAIRLGLASGRPDTACRGGNRRSLRVTGSVGKEGRCKTIWLRLRRRPRPPGGLGEHRRSPCRRRRGAAAAAAAAIRLLSLGAARPASPRWGRAGVGPLFSLVSR